MESYRLFLKFDLPFPREALQRNELTTKVTLNKLLHLNFINKAAKWLVDSHLTLVIQFRTDGNIWNSNEEITPREDHTEYIASYRLRNNQYQTLKANQSIKL